MKTLLFILSLLATTSLIAAPKAPLGAILLRIEQGQVATIKDKATVQLVVFQGKEKQEAYVRIFDEAMIAFSVSMSPEESRILAGKINELLTKAEDGANPDPLEVGKLIIATVADTAGVVFGITDNSGGPIRIREKSIALTGDNARTLARLLERAADNYEWLDPKARKLFSE